MSQKNNINTHLESGNTEDILLAIESLAHAVMARTEYLIALESSLDSIWAAILISVAGGISAALAAYLFTCFHSRSVRKKENCAHMARNLNEQILILEEKSIYYWLSDFDKNDETLQTSEALSIKSILTVLRSLTQAMPAHLIKKENELLNELKCFNGDMYDLITGEDFESKDRQSSKNKATKISKKCGIMRSKIVKLEYSIV